MMHKLSVGVPLLADDCRNVVAFVAIGVNFSRNG